MYLSIPNKSLIITEKTKIERGDIIVKDDIVKRVIGTEGDNVILTNGLVYVNDSVVLINDNPLKCDEYYNMDVVVEDDFYFLLGESLDSLDSKQLGLYNNIDTKVTRVFK